METRQFCENSHKLQKRFYADIGWFLRQFKKGILLHIFCKKIKLNRLKIMASALTAIYVKLSTSFFITYRERKKNKHFSRIASVN